MAILSDKIKLAFGALALACASFGAQAQVPGIPSFDTVLQKAAPVIQAQYNQQKQNVQAPVANKKTASAPQAQQSEFQQNASALGNSVIKVGSGTLDVVENTVKTAVSGVSAAANGIGGFFKNALSTTPEFSQEKFESDILGKLNTSTDIQMKNANVMNGKKAVGAVHTYVIKQGDVVYGLTVSNAPGGQNCIETLNNPRFKSDENPKGYSKITLDPSVAMSFEQTLQQNRVREPATQNTNSNTGWGGPSYGG